MDDVTFGRNGAYDTSGVVIPGRSLMSMNALFCNTLQDIISTTNMAYNQGSI